MSDLTAVILGAGDATRMRSARPKVLHPPCGRALTEYPVRAARALGARTAVVVGHAAVVEQAERRGTGHAGLQAREAWGEDAGPILVLPGDMPLRSEGTLRRLV